MNLNGFQGAMRAFSISTVAAAALIVAGPASADPGDTLVFNSAPADTWYFGSGNDYVTANTLVLTTDAGDQLYARAHGTFQQAPASTGNLYSFPTGLTNLSFDWGIDSHTGSFAGVTALITLTNYAGGAPISYDPFFVGNDNESLNGSVQNSYRWNWLPPTFFDLNADATYNFKLDVSGLDGGDKSINFDMKVGNGFSGAVPEPGTWALMIGGFGMAGAMLRRRRAVTA